MRKVFRVFLIFGIWASLVSLAGATTITYQLNDLGSGSWEYIYSVTNDTLLTDIEEFTVYFDYGLYSNLSVDNQKPNWDGLTVQPDLFLGLPTIGYFDTARLVAGIAPGGTEGGFQVSFTWLGAGTPGTQFFEVVDPDNFNVLDSGNTSINSVPEPGTLGLLLFGGIGLLGFRRKIG
jgi:hypothetical protein